MCLKDLRDEFIYDCECRHLAKGSLRNYKAATRFLLEYLELKQITELEDVRPRHIRDLMKERQDAGSTSRYINDLLKAWRTWFNYLVNEGYLEERDNPVKKVKCLRQPRTIIDNHLCMTVSTGNSADRPADLQCAVFQVEVTPLQAADLANTQTQFQPQQ